MSAHTLAAVSGSHSVPHDGLVDLPSDAPAAFREAVRSLRRASPRREVVLKEIPPPQRLAPWSFVFTAEVPLPASEEFATGRLVLLYDPEGQEAWDGTFRIVTYVTSEVDAEMANDPLFGQVSWGWLVESLERAGAGYVAAGGTVTRTVSTRFGDLAGDGAGSDASEDICDVEIRASWTPGGADLSAHVRAWCEFLCTTAGLPPPGVTALHPSGRPPIGAA